MILPDNIYARYTLQTPMKKHCNTGSRYESRHAPLLRRGHRGPSLRSCHRGRVWSAVRQTIRVPRSGLTPHKVSMKRSHFNCTRCRHKAGTIRFNSNPILRGPSLRRSHRGRGTSAAIRFNLAGRHYEKELQHWIAVRVHACRQGLDRDDCFEKCAVRTRPR